MAGDDDWRARATRMGRTTARLREGHMPDVQIWSTRIVRPTRDPCITCSDALDTGPEAVEVFSAEGVRLLFHVECHDMWMAFRERSSRQDPPR
jgi:hypothetical protein